MAEVICTEQALADLNEIAEYIAFDKPSAAAALVQRVFYHVAQLATHPKSGSRIPELLPASRYRQIVEPPCRVFYRYDQAAHVSYILAVIRGEQLFEKWLLLQRDTGTTS